MGTGLEKIYRHLEAWGYPQQGIDWLRRHRLPVIVILAALSWITFVAVLVGLYQLSFRISDLAASAFAVLG
jgi:hypothetical protein